MGIQGQLRVRYNMPQYTTYLFSYVNKPKGELVCLPPSLTPPLSSFAPPTDKSRDEGLVLSSSVSTLQSCLVLHCSQEQTTDKDSDTNKWRYKKQSSSPPHFCSLFRSVSYTIVTLNTPYPISRIAHSSSRLPLTPPRLLSSRSLPLARSVTATPSPSSLSHCLSAFGVSAT